VSELRDQYQRISSKNQDVDPLVHEELKSKYQALEKSHAEAAEKCFRMNAKLTEKKAEQVKHQSALTDLQQRLELSQTASADAQQRHDQQRQELQLQHQQQQQELKQQQEKDRVSISQLEKIVEELKKELAALRASVPQQEKDKLTIFQLEQTVEELKRELAALRASNLVVGIAAAAVPNSSEGKSQPSNVDFFAPPTSAVAAAAAVKSVVFNPAAAAFGAKLQSQPSASAETAAVVPPAIVNADSAAEVESSGEKRSGDSTPVGAKQTKRVLRFLCHVCTVAFNAYFLRPRFLSQKTLLRPVPPTLFSTLKKPNIARY